MQKCYPHILIKNDKFYPVIGSASSGTAIETNFGDAKLAFDMKGTNIIYNGK